MPPIRILFPEEVDAVSGGLDPNPPPPPSPPSAPTTSTPTTSTSGDTTTVSCPEGSGAVVSSGGSGVLIICVDDPKSK